jgi:uncharacterized protein YjiS (DUF1127 family)
MMHAQHVSAANRGLTGAVATTARIVGGYWLAFWAWRARRATVELLHGLDDRTLHDIGISRGEISSAVYGRAGDRKRCYDDAWRLRISAWPSA